MSTHSSENLRAFSVTVRTWIPEHVGIYAASSRSKARFAAWKAAQDAGFDTVTFGQLRVLRVPEFDLITHKLKRGVDREYACLLKFEATRQTIGEA